MYEPAHQAKNICGFIYITACFLFLCAALAIRAERLPVRVYTSANGLGSSAAFSLVRDWRGFIWLCSRDGLIRFDGYRFITYRIGNDDADPAVFNLLPTRSGVYWINLNRGTDYRFVAKDDSTPIEPIHQQPAKNDPRIPLDVEPLNNDSPMPIYEDRDGNLWTANNKGLFLMSEVDGRFISEPVELKLPGNPVSGLNSVVFQQGRDGSLWIGTHWGLVRRLPNGKQIHYSLNPENNSDLVQYLAEDPDGKIWIARREGLLVLKVEPLSELSGLEDYNARKIVIKQGIVNENGAARLPAQSGEAFSFSFADFLRRNTKKNSGEESTSKPQIFGILGASDGRIWITTSHGLVVFNGKEFQHYTSEQGLGSNPPSAIVEDREGLIWLASYSGLLRLNPNGLTTFDQKDGLAQTRIHSIYEDRDGKLNVVTDNWNISRLEDSNFKTGRPRLPDDAVLLWHSNVAFLDSRGDWWIITKEKIYRYTGVSRVEELAAREPAVVYSSREGLVSDNNYRVFEDANGDIWISTFPDSKPLGLTRWERATGKFQRFYAKDGLPELASVSAFGTDKAGNIWVGFAEEGLARYRGGRFTFFGTNDGAPHGLIGGIYSDKAGRLWVASSRDGLIRIDDPTAEKPVFKRYTIADGLTSNNIRCITEDLFGNIYVGTVRGVNRLSPETGQIKYYGTGDGLASDFVSVAYRDKSGVIWFGTFSGLSKLVPKPDMPSEPPPILISGLRIAGVDYSVSPLGQRQIFVPEQNADQNNIQIDFFSIETGEKASTRYQYKLEGSDSDWSAVTAERSVTFANLSPGTYRFLARAVNAENVASQQPAAVSFTILPPVWQRWWFLLLAALLIAGLIYLLYRYRVTQIIKLERVRTRIATDLHDDIGSSLSKIAILSEVARQKTGANGAGEPLEIIADTSRQMVDSMSDIVWAINPERDSLSDLIHRMRRFAEEILDAQDIEYEFAVPEHLREIALGADVRRDVYLIFKECINNLAKHSGATEANIAIEQQGENLIIEIKDNGRGFDVEETSNGNAASGFGGNGLRNIRRRAENFGGSLEIESETGKGTRIVLQIPVKRKLFAV